MQKFFLRTTWYVRYNALNLIILSLFLLGGSFQDSLYSNVEKPAVGKQPQFSYEHKTEVVYNREKGFALPSVIEQFGLKQNKYLNSSLFFDTSFIINTKRVRAHHIKKKPDKNRKKLVEIIAYCLNNNHYHLLLEQKHRRTPAC